jgi:hypothetical protein
VRKEGPMDIYFHILFAILVLHCRLSFFRSFLGEISSIGGNFYLVKQKYLTGVLWAQKESRKTSTSPKKSEKSPYFYIKF